MGRAVALLVGVLLMAGCTATVDGRAETDAAAGQDGRLAPADTGPASPGSANTGPTPSVTTTSGADTSAPDSADPGTAASTTATTSGPPATGTGESSVGTAVELPPGFYGADTDLGYRPMSTDEFDCTPDQASGCFGIMVFAADGCPTGATVTVGIFDKAVDPTNPIGTATGVTPAIAAGDSQPVVIADSTGVAGQLTARVQSVTC